MQKKSAQEGAAKPDAAALPYGNIVSIIGRTLGAANQYLVSLMNREGLAGIVPSHGDILMQLFAHESLTMAELAKNIRRDPSTVTALVRKLIEAGYVEKTPSAHDGRVHEVRLTDKGRTLAPAVGRISADLISTLTRGIRSSQLGTTCTTLKTMYANLNPQTQH